MMKTDAYTKISEAIVFLATGRWEPYQALRMAQRNKRVKAKGNKNKLAALEEKLQSLTIEMRLAEDVFLEGAREEVFEIFGIGKNGCRQCVPASLLDRRAKIDLIQNTLSLKGYWVVRDAEVLRKDIQRLAKASKSPAKNAMPAARVPIREIEAWFKKERIPLYRKNIQKGLTDKADWQACKKHFGNKASQTILRQVRRKMLEVDFSWALKRGKR